MSKKKKSKLGAVVKPTSPQPSPPPPPSTALPPKERTFDTVPFSRGVENLLELVRKFGPNFEQCPWSEQRLLNVLKELPSAGAVELRIALEEMARLGKTVQDALIGYKTALADLTRNQAELVEQRTNLANERTQIDEERAELRANQERLTGKESELNEREMDARNGFAGLKISELAKFHQGLADLDVQRDELIRGVDAKATATRQELLERKAEVESKEGEIARREAQTRVERQRLEAEWRSISQEREQVAADARREAELVIEDLKGRLQLQEDKTLKALALVEAHAAEFQQNRELTKVLAGRSPTELMGELYAAHSRIRELEQSRDAGGEEDLRSALTATKAMKDALQLRLDEVEPQLADISAQLQRQRLGVADREVAEREIRALQRHKQILSSRLDDLGNRVEELTQVNDAEQAFPQLKKLDAGPARLLKLTPAGNLKQFSEHLQDRIATAEPNTRLFYRQSDIRLLVGGLAMSQLHILQGISGTGKTSLAKAFAKAVGGVCTDISVQAGWRDRDDLLGHYNSFEKRFYEKDCLQALYRAQIDSESDRIHVILLDEMNLSRPEQYFAEFLSALEKNDPRERLITLSESALKDPPTKLVNGRQIRVPENVWFMGTANHDETTNEFADKTYDRAHVISLPKYEKVVEVVERPQVHVSWKSLSEQFAKAREEHAPEVERCLDILHASNLSRILLDQFDVGWGNRFERHALSFAPVVKSAGGSCGEALDHLLASKVLRRGKVVGRYDSVQNDIADVLSAVRDLEKAWKSALPQSVLVLEKELSLKARAA